MRCTARLSLAAGVDRSHDGAGGGRARSARGARPAVAWRSAARGCRQADR